MTGVVPLKEAGFFESAEATAAVAGSAESPWEAMAARYLEQGVAVVVSPSWVGDMLNSEVGMVCQYATLTDGTWIWPSDLVYYLRTYHLALPEGFLMHMASRDWIVPELNDTELDEICDRLELQYGISPTE